MKTNRRDYKTGVEKYDALIEELAGFCALPDERELIREILTTTAKLGLEEADHGDLKLINSALKELRYSFKLFSPYREKRKVTVFGSARSKEDSPEYRKAEEFSRKIVKHGFMVITGAGGGVMEAANKGAGKGNSFGVNIKIPFEQKPNPYIADDDSRLINFKYFFTRKLIFIKESSATVLFPGGYGTNDECFEILTLFQTGKTLPRPIIMVDPNGCDYWKRCIEYLHKSMLKYEFIDKDNLKLFTFTEDVDEAVEETVTFYRVYHSLRYIKDITVFRLNRKITEGKLRELNKDFQDILVDGQIEQKKALPEEIKNNDYPDLPRLVFKFNKRNFGRLREMINAVNTD